jgi:hypothetical protein
MHFRRSKPEGSNAARGPAKLAHVDGGVFSFLLADVLSLLNVLQICFSYVANTLRTTSSQEVN